MRPTRDWVHVISCGTFTPRRDLCGGRRTATSTAPSTRGLDRTEGASGRRYVPFDWGLTTRSDDEAEEPSIGETYVVC